MAARPASGQTLPPTVTLSNHNGVKRLFDVVGAALLMIASSPVWLLAAIAIKLESPGPVFFRQKRIGRGGLPFRMMKFRKMPEDLPTQGPMLTRRSDPRLTRVGALLERTKLDELPQLINVLVGEMSLIGPRPEVEKFVDLNDDRWQVILSARPGLFGISQIQGRNEASLYPDDCQDIEAFYRESILPEKLDRDAQYVKDAGLAYDLKLLIQGILVSAFGTVTGSSIHAHAPQVAMLGVDMLASFAALWFSLHVFAGGTPAAAGAPTFWGLLGACTLARGAMFLGMGVYRRRPHTLTSSDFIRIIKSVLYGSTAFLALSWMFGSTLPSSVLLFDALVLAAILIAKAYAISQVLRSQVKQKLWWSTSRAIAMAVGGALLGAVSFIALLRVLEPLQLTVAPIQHLAWLAAAYVAIRGYGLYRYGLLEPKQGLLKDLPRILGGTAVGSLLIYLSDAVFYSTMVTPVVLGFDLVLSLIAVLAVRRKLWEGAAADEREEGVEDETDDDAQLLLVGAGPETEFFLSYLETVIGSRPPVLGVLDSRSESPRAQTINGIRILGNFAQLRSIVEAHELAKVIYFPDALSEGQEKEMKSICRSNQTSVRAFPDLMKLSLNGHRPSSKE